METKTCPHCNNIALPLKYQTAFSKNHGLTEWCCETCCQYFYTINLIMGESNES